MKNMSKHGPKIWGNWSANWDFKVFVKAEMDQKYEETDLKF